MDAFIQQTVMSLRLHYRNRMALLYSYLFPLIFLLAFYVLYRYERVVLIRHMGELLTVGILGGACFGLPTTLVSERERGVWRRYRLAPVPTAGLVSSTIAARYAILVTAGLLQIALALLLGMPLPRHPLQLWIAFTCVSFAFVGLGLVMATMADNVPAVQALGQCIFLPMLIIGGVAVPLASLPDWAQHLSAFFPGRYAVQAIQASVNGSGLGAARFDLLALVIIGAAGCVAGGMLFRWDAQQRFAAQRGRGWIVVALAAWVAVGAMAEMRHRVATGSGAPVSAANQAAESPAGTRTPPAEPALPPEPRAALGESDTAGSAAPSRPTITETGTPAPRAGLPAGGAADRDGSVPRPAGPSGRAPEAGKPPAGREAASAAPRNAPAPPPSQSQPVQPVAPPPVAAPAGRGDGPGDATSTPKPPAQPIAATWQSVKPSDIDRDLIFTRLPPDSGIVAPIAPPDEEPPPEVLEQLDAIRVGLPAWAPARTPDLVQRARNILYIAAVPDVHQTELERFAPALVFDELEQQIPKDDLTRVLYWIALHPMDGDDSAIDQLPALGFENRGVDVEQARERAALYAVKLLGRVTGAIRRF